MYSPTAFRDLTSTDRLWEKVSKVYFPWYLPIPLMPTPPKGRVSTVETKVKCKQECTFSTHQLFSIYNK